MPEERKHRLGLTPALWGIVLLAGALRFYALDFGFPHLEAGPDEVQVANRALRFFTGDLNPHFFQYPTLYLYLSAAIFGVAAFMRSLLGGDLADIVLAAAVHPEPMVLSARLASAVAGTLTPIPVYLAARELWNERAGLAAALFMAASVVHVRDSHVGRPDAVLGLFVALAGLYVLWAHDRGGVREFIWAGLYSGLAASTKYVGLVFAGPVAALLGWAHLKSTAWTGGVGARGRRLAAAVWAAARDRRIWLFAAAGVVAFVSTTPYSVLDHGLFRNHFLFQLGHLEGGHGLDLGPGGWYHLGHTLPVSLGWPVFVASLAGGVLTFRRDGARGVAFFLFPALFYLLTAGSRTVFLRYMIPLFPFACVAAGVSTAYLGGWLARRWAPGREAWVTMVLALGLALPPLSRSVQFNRFAARVDSRVLAAEWLETDAPAGENFVHQTGALYGRLQLPPTTDSLRARRERIARQSAWGSPDLERAWAFSVRVQDAEIEALVAIPRAARFTPVTFDEETGGFGGGVPPAYVVVLESPLVLYSAVPDRLRAVLTRDYERVKEVPGAGGPDAPGWYDQHDAFYLPVANFGGVARPGPDVTIYRRKGSATP